MRLICPSCGAQYEVDESVIPDAGRDVQCSNCGHAWFQKSARQLRDDEENGFAEVPPPGDEPVVEDAVDTRASGYDIVEEAEEDLWPQDPLDTPAAPDVPERTRAPEVYEDEEEDAADEKPGAPRVRKTLDDAVRNVLREEAEREARVRMAEGTANTPFASGLTVAPAAVTTAVAAPAPDEEPRRDRAARVRGAADDFEDDALVSRATRRELLPDIEEINSSLRPTSERGDEPASFDAPETVARQRSGFRLGFSTVMLIAVILVGIYVLAPMLSKYVPALEPVLSGFVGMVDAIRAWLDEAMKSVTSSIKGSPG